VRDHRHALVIGKFYPPHRGHHDLIRRAAREADRVTVLVMGSSFDSIPTAERVAWLRAEHATDQTVDVAGVRCDAPVNIHDETVWAAQVGVMRAGARSVNREPVDLVASGEVYGDELARRLGADHFRVDRMLDPINATMIRRDIAGHWDALAHAVRAGLSTRVVVLGAESTGTTTLAGDLVDRYRTRGGVWRHTGLVTEFGRDYTEVVWDRQRPDAPTVNDLVWSPHDFDVIAAEQTKLETAVAGSAPLLVSDTDAFATAIWERRYLGDAARRDPAWAHAPRLPRRDLYLLTDHVDVPWDDDGRREGDLAIRAEMTTWFEDALTAAGHSWFPVTGTRSGRLQIAVEALDALIRRRLTFAEPVRGPGFEPTSS
jgi:HTH-type transcriptional regulator, transcriptional repressor of NAD biosynthesis genes